MGNLNMGKGTTDTFYAHPRILYQVYGCAKNSIAYEERLATSPYVVTRFQVPQAHQVEIAILSSGV